MPLIDTLTLKTELLDGGMPEPQAAAIVADIRMEIKALRGEIKMLRWIGGVILACQVLVFGKLFFT